MNRDEIIAAAEKFTLDSPKNYVSGDAAIRPEYAGMQIFEPPIFAFGAPNDDIFDSFKSPGIIGEHFMSPPEWLPGAKTVISFFLPYTERIKAANAADFDWPAEEWLHGRIEGQHFVGELLLFIKQFLTGAGYESLAPSLDKRFKTGDANGGRFTSNWSERHAGFACGLGTFGLSKGIITKKGMCGRVGSVITELSLPADKRPYNNVYEYCIMCGECIRHCPARSISFEEGKEHGPCSAFLDKVSEKHSPRYGCGKCQVRVPCESGIPKA